MNSPKKPGARKRAVHAAEALFKKYVSVWRAIQAADVAIRYELAADGRGEAASFQHDGWAEQKPGGGFRKKERIRVHRPHQVTNPETPTRFDNGGEPIPLEALRKELVTIIHEFGHVVTYRGANKSWTTYHQAAVRRDQIIDAIPSGDIRGPLFNRLSVKERDLIVEEEILAWTHGRPLVPKGLLAEYKATARRHVHYHRYRMGMDELWPGDEVGD